MKGYNEIPTRLISIYGRFFVVKVRYGIPTSFLELPLSTLLVEKKNSDLNRKRSVSMIMHFKFSATIDCS